jgi:ATP-dependent helicase HrpB
LTEGRRATLARESVVQKAPLFVAASIRDIAARGAKILTLLTLASAVRMEWIESVFPHLLHRGVEHVYDRTHKRVAAVRRTRFGDLLLQEDHMRDPDPIASGRCLAEAHLEGCFELPLFNHEIKQWIARANFIAATAPDLEFPAFDPPTILACLGKAFEGCTLAKEAQTLPVRNAFVGRLPREWREWMDELAPASIPWHDGRKLKLLYPDLPIDKSGRPNPPEIQVKLHECFPLTHHPRLCEGRAPVKLWLCAPNGKRLEATTDWLSFKAAGYAKLKPTLLKKFPGVPWI